MSDKALTVAVFFMFVLIFVLTGGGALYFRINEDKE